MHYKFTFRIEQRLVGFEIQDWQQRQLLVALSSRTGKNISTRCAKNGNKINNAEPPAMATQQFQLAALDNPPVTMELMDWQRWQVLRTPFKRNRRNTSLRSAKSGLKTNAV